MGGMYHGFLNSVYRKLAEKFWVVKRGLGG
jgi:hypothetical protein